MTVIDVLGYPIIVETGVIEQAGALVRRHAPAHSYAVVVDESVARHYLHRVHDAIASGAGERIHTVVIPPGEHHKTREQWAAITDSLLGAGFGRDTTIVALGGGVIGDLAGFVAATYMRGVRIVQIPTTLLAMVDASVGGKTAVDTPAGKNTVGAFHPPSLVLIDPSTLTTLPARELRAGFAEVIKHGVIADRNEIAEAAQVATAMRETGSAHRALESLIQRSVGIKAAVVTEDERELGRRKVLNFGHTIGHGVEAASDYALLHGEAVAIGMVAEARVAEHAGIAEPGTAAEIEQAAHTLGLPTRIPSTIRSDRVLELMASDKKRRLGQLEYALPKRVGEMAGRETGWGIPIADAIALEIIRGLY